MGMDLQYGSSSGKGLLRWNLTEERIPNGSKNKLLSRHPHEFLKEAWRKACAAQVGIMEAFDWDYVRIVSTLTVVVQVFNCFILCVYA